MDMDSVWTHTSAAGADSLTLDIGDDRHFVVAVRKYMRELDSAYLLAVTECTSDRCCEGMVGGRCGLVDCDECDGKATVLVELSRLPLDVADELELWAATYAGSDKQMTEAAALIRADVAERLAEAS